MTSKGRTIAVICPYCNNIADIVSGDRIYPHRPDLAEKKFYLCTPCDAYVGCHPGTTKPLGRLADKTLRRAKVAAHNAFDPLWRAGPMTRLEAYQWLAEALGIAFADCHIGFFDLQQCQRVTEICLARLALFHLDYL